MPTEVTLTKTDGFEELVNSDAMARIAAAADLSTFAKVSDFRVSTVPTQRKIIVQPGVAYDSFIRVEATQAMTLDVDTPTTGGQWWYLVIERSWAGGGRTRLLMLRGAATPDGFSAYLDDSAPPAGLRYEPGLLTHQIVATVWAQAGTPEVRTFDRRRFKNPAENIAPYRHMLHLTSSVGPVGIRPNWFGGINENILNVAQYRGRAREFFEAVPSQPLSPFYRIRMLQDVRIHFDYRISTHVQRGGDQGSVKTMVLKNWDRENDDPHSDLIIIENEVPGELGHRLWHQASAEHNMRKGDTVGLTFQTYGLANAGGILAGNSQGRTEISPYTCHFDMTVAGPHF